MITFEKDNSEHKIIKVAKSKKYKKRTLYKKYNVKFDDIVNIYF